MVSATLWQSSLSFFRSRYNFSHERARAQANKLHDRINSIDQVSSDLFNQWQGEISEMGNANLKSRSTALLRDAKERAGVYIKAMRKTESQMTPVINSVRDQVLFLKHDLNSKAIGSLKGMSAKIDTDITALMQSMDTSLQEADKLISSLGATDDDKKYLVAQIAPGDLPFLVFLFFLA